MRSKKLSLTIGLIVILGIALIFIIKGFAKTGGQVEQAARELQVCLPLKERNGYHPLLLFIPLPKILLWATSITLPPYWWIMFPDLLLQDITVICLMSGAL
ncbi:MAG: hypothetical protein ACOX1Z_01910 [Candidatus Ratteibacteria bacterium]